MAEQAGYSTATLANATRGRRLPSLAVTLALVRACGGDPEEWEQRWRVVAAECAATVGSTRGAKATDAQSEPYRGLHHYGVEDAASFFGRRRLVEQIMDLLSERRLIAVFGVSGSGKSSLLRAGVIAAVHADQKDDRRTALVTPGPQPVAALRDALAARAPGQRLLLVVDQFEELFTLCADVPERTRFVAELAALVEQSDSGVQVVVAVRADFYARCAELPRLAELLAGANIPVGPLSDEELQEVITQPPRQAGLTVERALVTKVLADASGQVGALPLVSHALLETWRQRRGELLTVAGYDAAGGLAGAVAQTAEAVYQRLSPRQRDTAQQVLTRLVTLGDGVADTRRRARTTELDFPEVQAVLGELTASRLIVLDEDAVEVAHEALITAWPRLTRWLQADRAMLHAHRQLTEAAQLWHRLGRDPDALLRGARLAAWEGDDLSHLTALERTFLSTSWDRASRDAALRRRRVRLVFASLAAGVLVMSLLAGLALIQARRADARRGLAVSRQLVANARDQLQVDQEVALLLAMKAYDTAATEETDSALRQAVADSRVRDQVWTGHGRTFGVSFSPDGRRIATSGEDGAVRIWERSGTGRVETASRVLRAHTGNVWSPVFSPDGRWLAAGGADGMITVWDLTVNADPVVLRGHTEVVSKIAFSPDGLRLASTSGDGTVRIWEPTAERPPLVLTVPDIPIGVAFSPDGAVLAAGGQSGPIWLWAASGQGEPRVLRGHEGYVKDLAFSPDGRRLASGSSDGTVRLWGVDTDAPPLVLPGNDGFVESVAFSPDGRRVASGHSDGTNAIRIWSTAGAADPLVLYGHDGPVWSIAFSPDGAGLASVSSDGTVRRWDPGYPGAPRMLAGHTGAAWAVTASSDGNLVVSGGQDSTVRLWRSGAPTVLSGHDGDVFDVATTPDGRWVASTGKDRTVRVWDASTGAQVAVFTGHERAAMTVSISTDGRRVAAASSDSTVRVWDVFGHAEPRVLRGHLGAVRAVALSPDGRRLASGGEDGTVRLWDVSGGDEPAVLRTGPAGLVWRLAYSPDGRRLVASGHDGLLQIWNGDGSGKPTVLRGHQGNVWSVAYSPDGRLLATSGERGGLRIWRAGTGQHLVELSGHAASVEGVVFTGDGLVSAHDDGTVRLWRCEVCAGITRVRDLARTRVTRELSAEESAAFFDPGSEV